MRRYRFLLSRRWVGAALVAVLVSTVCVFLGIWQLNRHVDRAAANELVNTNYDRAPVPIAEVLEGSGTVPADEVWRPVETSGTYVGRQLLVRNRPVDGTPAVRVLAVLRTGTDGGLDDGGPTDGGPADDGGPLVVVDRGWVPLGDQEVDPPAYPDGEVQLLGRLRLAEPPDSRTAPDGQVYAIDPGNVLAAAGVEAAAGVDGTAGVDARPALDGYLLAVEEDPAPAGEMVAFPRPETSPGNHLSYAFQWWVFALGALVGFVVLARREAAEVHGETPGRARPRGRRHSDADEEDALIDAQLDRS